MFCSRTVQKSQSGNQAPAQCGQFVATHGSECCPCISNPANNLQPIATQMRSTVKSTVSHVQHVALEQTQNVYACIFKLVCSLWCCVCELSLRGAPCDQRRLCNTQNLNFEDAAALAALFGTYNCCDSSGISIRIIGTIKRLNGGKRYWSCFLCTYSSIFFFAMVYVWYVLCKISGKFEINLVYLLTSQVARSHMCDNQGTKSFCMVLGLCCFMSHLWQGPASGSPVFRKQKLGGVPLFLSFAPS